MSIHQHKKHDTSAHCMVLTISDTRTPGTDKSGDLIVTMLEEAGHVMALKKIIADDAGVIQNDVSAGCENAGVDILLLNGGTGIAHRDVTIETIQPMLDKEMNGFGEIFRMLSYQEDIGSAAILSRAIAGVIGNTAVFAMPGSSGAVKLAMQRLIIPEISHVVHELRKDSCH
ncbi:MogA/MoaB family molybdenum cofactor biosynthesis protein [Lentibacillus salinarum]|uniref:Molybdenum cofactor biosynthesis protein B n=1 Tax=Lentibacillus salinarum TaxID=446820 RepID=A0ABW3ZV90_9BACI